MKQSHTKSITARVRIAQFVLALFIAWGIQLHLNVINPTLTSLKVGASQGFIYQLVLLQGSQTLPLYFLAALLCGMFWLVLQWASLPQKNKRHFITYVLALLLALIFVAGLMFSEPATRMLIAPGPAASVPISVNDVGKLRIAVSLCAWFLFWCIALPVCEQFLKRAAQRCFTQASSQIDGASSALHEKKTPKTFTEQIHATHTNTFPANVPIENLNTPCVAQESTPNTLQPNTLNTDAHTNEAYKQLRGAQGANAKGNFTRSLKQRLCCLEHKHPFLTCFCILVLLWLPYLIVCAPATSDPNDTLNQFIQAQGRIDPTLELTTQLDPAVTLSNAHPVMHTLFLNAFLTLGAYLGSQNYGLLLIALVQLGVWAASISYVMLLAKRLQFRFAIRAVLVAFFGLMPLFPLWIVNVTKDSLFSATTLLFCALLTRVVLSTFGVHNNMRTQGSEHVCTHAPMSKSRSEATDTNVGSAETRDTALKTHVSYFFEAPKIRVLIGLFACALVMSLLRNNGIFAVAFAFIATLICARKTPIFKGLLVSLGVCMLCYGAFISVVLPAAHISPGSPRETMSLIFEQVGRVAVCYPSDISENDKRILRAIFDFDKLEQTYQGEQADDMKWTYNKYASAHERAEFFKLWVRWGLQHPLTYALAQAQLSYAYFYPGVDRSWVWPSLAEFGTRYGLRPYTILDYYHEQGLRVSQPAFFAPARQALVALYNCGKTSPLALLCNMGFASIVTLILASMVLINKKQRALICFMPNMTLLLVFLMTPINGSIRYALGVVVCYPLLMLLTLVLVHDE